MKRLLAYILIVFGLGSIFNVNSDAKEKYICLKHASSGNYFLILSGWGPDYDCSYKVIKKHNKKIYSKLRQKFNQLPGGAARIIIGTELFKITSSLNKFNTALIAQKKEEERKKQELLLAQKKEEERKKQELLLAQKKEEKRKVEAEETQIAKAEPSQTQKVSADDYPYGLSKNKQYKYTTQFLKDGDYIGAEKALKKFLEINPNHKLSGSAQYWLAETFRVRQLYTDAAENYLIGYQKYPKGTKAPINLLKLGVSLVQIGEKDPGCKMIVGMVLQYPKASGSVKEKAKYEAQRFKCDKRDNNYLAKIPKLLKEYDLEAKKESSQTLKVAEKNPIRIPYSLIDEIYEENNKSLDIEYFNMENIYKKKKDVSKADIEKFVKENKDLLKDPDLTDQNINEEIRKLVHQKIKFDYNKNILEEIQSKKFDNSKFNDLAGNNKKIASINSIIDDKLFEINSVKLLYSLPENSFTLVNDKDNKIYLVKIIGLNKNILTKTEFVNILRNSTLGRKLILKKYDDFLSKKYKVQINQKSLDKLKDAFKGNATNNANLNKIKIAKINKKNVTTQDVIDYINQSGISLDAIRNNLDKNIIEELLSGLISTTLIALEIKDYNLTVDILKTIKQNKNFQDEGGVFQKSKYEKFLLTNNMSAPMYELQLKNKELQKLLFDSVVAGKIPLIEKAKVAKVEEPKQEEFKPKKTNQDNEAPVIEIAEAITVNDTSYILEGRVTDKADKIFVEIDGQPVRVKKGKFKVKRYSPVDEQIKIVAIDQWGNKSKTKLVNITIDIDETIVANKLEPLDPSNISNKSSNNKVALIIGIENYTEAPKANYANLDAKYFFDYARRAFGVKKKNINLLVNEEATVVKTDKALSLWLKSKIKKNRSDLIIFFAGHGLASSDGKELYLLPQDGNPDRLERTALSRTDLFKEIISLNPKSVTMFLDTCYSGVSRDEQMLLASARPIRIVADEQEGIPDNFTIFSASQLDQISSGLKEANHGIFSYFLMKGLEGKADSNQDKKITNGELLAYMDENISQKAAEQGREQNPSLAGDPNKVLMSYR